jgi:CBS domain-containing protein
MLIGTIMSTQIGVCRPEADLASVATLMRDLECASIPVLDVDAHPIAVITERDILMAALASGKPLVAMSVSEAMGPPLAVCQPSDSLDEVESVMRLAHSGRALVVNELGVMVGVVSLGDIARARTRSNDDPVELAVTTHTLAVVSAPLDADAATDLATLSS